jgi:DNA-directed RNA polymerase specialized sigma24 family protein
MDDLDQELQAIIRNACRYPSNSPQHRQALNALFRALLNSGQVWRTVSNLYEDALSETMMFVSQRLCEIYREERGTFLAWFNTCLRNRYNDRVRAEPRNQVSEPLNLPVAGIDATVLCSVWESFVRWIEEDSDLVLASCYIRGIPMANCQMLAKLRVIQGQEWMTISQLVGAPRSSITSHWCRRCKPLIQVWLDQNYPLFGEDFYER